MLEDKVLKTIRDNEMLGSGDKVIIGVSGGFDSTALLYLLDSLKTKLGIKLYVAHLNHKIRGAESDKDMEYVKKISKKLGITCFCESFDVPGFAKQKKMNLEDAARTFRYGYFERVAVKTGANKIASGHNADDNIETFIMRLIRGSGLKGLRGIPAVRGGIIRPLINTYRKDIEHYLKEKNIKPRTDQSNFDTSLFRNRIRHELLPLLESYNSNIKDALQRSIRLAKQEYDLIEREAEKLCGKLATKKTGMISLNVRKLSGLNIAVASEIMRKAIAYVKKDLVDISSVNIDDIFSILSSKRGKLNLTGAFIEKKKDRLLISAKMPQKTKEKQFSHTLYIPGETNVNEAGYTIESELISMSNRLKLKIRDPLRALVDYDKIKAPLIIRNRKPGDVFYPLGLKGKKKLQDIFVDEKIDIDERDRIPVVEDGKNIVWIVGYRVSDKAKVTPKTNKVVRLTARQL